MTTTIVPTIETSNNELVVSSEQIALGAGVEHRATLQLIETNRPELEEFGGVAFEMRTFATAGGNQQKRVALLNEPQAMLLMTFQRNTAQVKAFKVALIKEFKRLATQQAPALTEEQIVHRALQITAAKVQQLEAKIEQDAGKVAYVDNHVKPEDVSLFSAVAKNLEVAQKDLRDALIYRRWIYISKTITDKDGRTAHEYSACANHSNHFRHCKVHTVTGRKNGWHTLKLTPEGVAAVTRFVERVEDKFGTVKEALPALKRQHEQRLASMRAPRKDIAA